MYDMDPFHFHCTNILTLNKIVIQIGVLFGFMVYLIENLLNVMCYMLFVCSYMLCVICYLCVI